MRIVSLLGSATEIVFELGLQQHLVGISHECDFPSAAMDLPRLSKCRFDPEGMTGGQVDAAVRACMAEYGSVYEIDTRLLKDLKPDIVLTQAVCDVCAVPTGSVEEAVSLLPTPVAVVSLDAHSLEGIIGTFHQVGAAAGEPNRAARIEAQVRARLADLESRVRRREQPTVLMLEWLNPPFAPGHWVPEMVTLAGGVNLLGEPHTRSVEASWEEVAAQGREADYLLIEPCGFDLDQAADDAGRHRAALERVAPGPMQRGGAWVLHSAWFSRSGPRVVEGIETLARIFHPTAFDDPPAAEIARRYS